MRPAKMRARPHCRPVGQPRSCHHNDRHQELLTGLAVNRGGQRSASPDERDPGVIAHQRAVKNTLRWAEESATRGRYADALAWLTVLDVIGEELPADYETKRVEWRRALAELTARPPG